MIAVLFEVTVAPGREDDYLALAGELREELEHVDGFVSVERFRSLLEPSRLLSLSFWQDEAAVATWRNQERHRAAQSAGRAGVFADYRLRVATVVRDYGPGARRDQAPVDSRERHGG